MSVWFHVSRHLDECVRQAARGLTCFPEPLEPEVRLADPRFGDFQANGILPYAKKLKQNPRELASHLLDVLKAKEPFASNAVEVSLAGPGFINFRLSAGYLLEWLREYKDEAALGQAASMMYNGKTIVVDYSSPNTAKQMHVGHLRSMVIGEAIQRMLRFCGAKIVRDNHIGDWGTQFGILIMAIKRTRYNLDNHGQDVLQELEALYKQGTAWTKEDPSALDEARKELVKLQEGDKENKFLWEKINKLSYEAFQELYTLFNVQFDAVLGESFYCDKVDRVYKELREVGLSEDSQGALVVFHPEHPRFAKQPFIIRKSDGATNYATTDLATALYRTEHFKADEIINVTDGRQQDHFEQLRLTVDKWFKAKGYRSVPMVHVWFGTILGEDGKAIKTRTGDPIKLKQLVAEAIERAYAIVKQKSPEFPEDEKQSIAAKVGIGAIRYADLSQNRTMDYVFSWDKMLSFDGNTSPYMLYAVARIHSIFRKAEITPGEEEANASALESEAELGLARKLMAFPCVLELALNDLRPHHLCHYLYEVAGAFSTFYNAEKVIVADEPVRARRLMLCARTLSVLEAGLHLLGIETLQRM